MRVNCNSLYDYKINVYRFHVKRAVFIYLWCSTGKNVTQLFDLCNRAKMQNMAMYGRIIMKYYNIVTVLRQKSMFLNFVRFFPAK